MQWIKASERLPEDEWRGCARYGVDGHQKAYSGAKKILGTIHFDKWSSPYASEESLKLIEWLDESTPSSEKIFTREDVSQAIKEHYKREFGELSDDSVQRDGYFIAGFVDTALDLYLNSK